MTTIPATIGGSTRQANIDDAPQAGGRSHLGEALSAIAQSNRGLLVGLPDGRDLPISNDVVRRLAGDGAGTEHRIATLTTELTTHHHVSPADARGVAVRLLGAIDQLASERLRRASPGDDVVPVSLGTSTDRVVPPTEDAPDLRRTSPRATDRPPTAVHGTVAPSARPEHRPATLRGETTFGVADLAIRGLGATALINGSEISVHDDATHATGEGRRLEITPASMFLLSTNADPVGELTRIARDQGIRLSRSQAQSVLDQTAATHDLPGRALEHTAARGVASTEVSTWSYAGTHPQPLHLTADEMRTIAATPRGDARYALIGEIAERQGFVLGSDPTDRMLTAMNISCDIQEQLGRAEANHLNDRPTAS